VGRISLIVVAFNRKDELVDCIAAAADQTRPPDEIVVVDNGSTDGTHALFAPGGVLDLPGLRHVASAGNLGVAGGRNLGIRAATGDLLVFVDDDALLAPREALAAVERAFEERGDVGVLAFKVVNHHTRTIRREEFPHADKGLDPTAEFETSYYVGAGHAIRASVFAACGLYPEDYFYGMEELDLSFRAIDRGFRIVYFPDAVVWHRKSPGGRVADGEKWVHCYRNRMAVAYKYLGRRHQAVAALVWFAAVARHSRSIAVPLRGLRAFLSCRPHLRREPVSAATIRRVARLGGRLWY
jgi:GT2 family glycosyltransferase